MTTFGRRGISLPSLCGRSTTVATESAPFRRANRKIQGFTR
jgi:hypothetical protein